MRTDMNHADKPNLNLDVINAGTMNYSWDNEIFDRAFDISQSNDISDNIKIANLNLINEVNKRRAGIVNTGVVGTLALGGLYIISRAVVKIFSK